MSDRLQEIRARLDDWQWQKDAVAEGWWDAARDYEPLLCADIAWLLAEVERMRTENGTELLPDDSVAQGVTKQERDA